jgi:hypothetical protein
MLLKLVSVFVRTFISVSGQIPTLPTRRAFIVTKIYNGISRMNQLRIDSENMSLKKGNPIMKLTSY